MHPFRLQNPRHLLALGLGAGLAPKAPGTFGTLVGVPVYLALHALGWPTYVAVVAAMFILGVWLCGTTARDVGVPDHGAIVWDEIVGFLVTMIAVPAQWPWVVAGFILFRFFDILKPWPIGLLDRKVHGGFGIMLDDLVAGVFALGLLHLVLWYV